MNALQEFSSKEDLNVHISFQLVGDSTYEQEKAAIEKHLLEFMGEIYTLDYEDPTGLQEREVVYRISKPIILDKDALRTYFINLKELFEATKRFLPAFTQSSEATA